MNQFLCSQTAAGFKIFVKLCAPLKKPDTGQRRATAGDDGGGEGGRGRDKVSGWAYTRCGGICGSLWFCSAESETRSRAESFRLPTRNLLNYLWQLSCNFILLPSTEPTFHRPRMLGTQRPPPAPCHPNSSPLLLAVSLHRVGSSLSLLLLVRNFDFSFLCSSSVISRSCAASHDQRTKLTVPPSPLHPLPLLTSNAHSEPLSFYFRQMPS